MGNKGGDTTTSTTSSDLPAYIKPYITDMLAKAQKVSNLPYQAYGDQRLAGFSGDTTKAFDMIRQQAGAGTPGVDAAMGTAGGIAGYQGAPITAQGTDAGQVTAGGTSAGKVNTGNFDFKGLTDADISGYMNPYINNVLDVQKNRANQSFAEQQAGRDAQAVAAGAFGGDRRFVSDSLAQRDLNQQLQGIEAEGLSSAYDKATGMFTSDEARRLAAYTSDADRRLEADTGNVNRRLDSDKFDVMNRLNADTGNMDRRLLSDSNDADRALTAAQASEESRRLGGALSLSGAELQGKLGQQQQDMQLGLAEALSGVGSKMQLKDQAGLDMAYQDFVNQRDYPASQLQMYSQLLSGTPITATAKTSTTAPAPDFLSQLAGLATSGAGLWDLFS